MFIRHELLPRSVNGDVQGQRHKMAEEKLFTLNLRRGFVKVPTWRKTKRAMDEIKKQLARYAKAETVILSKHINEFVWARGAKNPPPKITLKVEIDREKKIARAELAELSARAKRDIEKQKKAEAEMKKSEEKKEDIKKEAKPEKAADTKETPAEIKKEPDAKTEAETKAKAPKKLTRKQEISINK